MFRGGIDRTQGTEIVNSFQSASKGSLCRFPDVEGNTNPRSLVILQWYS